MNANTLAITANNTPVIQKRLASSVTAVSDVEHSSIHETAIGANSGTGGFKGKRCSDP